jgi:YHS domain-containing protein
LMTKDPVCGMDVEIARAAASSDYEGKTFYFCSLQCKEDFERQPDAYMNDR